MSVVTGFTNQDATLERPQLNDDGEPISDEFGDTLYSAPETIRVRKERRQRWVRSSSGVEIVASTYVLTESVINPDDRIDGRKVEAVEDIIAKNGTQLGTECYL
jgi:hypothetical protein